MSLGAVNSNHRVTRRKSVTTTAAANAAAAVAATMKDSNGESANIPVASHRRGTSGRRGLESSSVGAASGFSSYLSRSMNSPSRDSPVARKASPNSNDGSDSVNKPLNTKNRNRRASEGAHQVKGEGKRAMAELRCDRCGKGYKHGSCLSKHMCVYSPTLSCRLARFGACAMSALPRSPSWSWSSPLLSSPFSRCGLSRLTFWN